jgi:hypothetical protein
MIDNIKNRVGELKSIGNKISDSLDKLHTDSNRLLKLHKRTYEDIDIIIERIEFHDPLYFQLLEISNRLKGIN